MRGFGQLTLTQLRLFVRNRQALFWTFFLPVFMMVLLGSIIGAGGGVKLNLVVSDEDQSVASKQFVAELATRQGLEVQRAERKAGLQLVRRGERDMLLVIPSGFGDKATSAQQNGDPVTEEMLLYLDEGNPQEAEIGKTLVDQVIDEWNKKITDFRPVISLKRHDIQQKAVSYIDFLVPGIIALMIMSNSLNGVAATVASWRERGILRRLQGTPLKSTTFVASQITARIIFNSLQIMIVLAVAFLVFRVHNYGSWLLLLFFILLGTFTFMAIGFIIASLAKNPESAAPLAGLLSFFMIFLGGIFFPIRDLPGWLDPLVKVIPIGYLTEALRDVMNAGAGVADVWPEGLVLSAWLVGAFVISAWLFKWEAE